jgi:uncharacterized membrane protein (UPF0127 family)
MPKTPSLIIFLIVSLLIYLSIKLIIFKPSTPNTVTQKINDKNFILEVADTPYLQAKGLSSRSSLCPDCGMLFIFNRESFQSFWMKDTLIPLDIIFIKANGEITDIYTAFPESGKSDFQLSLYKSSQPIKYVIELNALTASNLNLKSGDLINLNLDRN